MKERGNKRNERKTRYKFLQDDLKEKRGNWQLKEVLDRTLWKTRFGNCYGHVLRQNTEKNEGMTYIKEEYKPPN